MLEAMLLRSPATSSGVFVGSYMPRGHRSGRKLPIVVRCVREYPPFPKVKNPLGRPTAFEEFVDSLPVIDKTKHKLTEYCTTVEGEECCSCWDAYFEMKDLEKKWPEEKLNEFLQRAARQGMKWLIRSLHHAAKLQKEIEDEMPETQKEWGKVEEEPPRHVPDGLPKTQEEIEEEEKALLPESDFTRLLKSLRIYPSWYQERPDVECY